MHPYLNIAIKAARLAGKIIINASLHLDSINVARKNNVKENFDLVTSVDQAAEEAIIKTILRAYPDHNIKAEEQGNIVNNSSFTWVIDPLDGTLNFVRDFPGFAVSIAILNEDQIEHAVIYNPLADELFTASKGSGAKLNNKRIRCSQNHKLSEAFLAVNTELLLQQRQNFAFLANSGLNRYFGSAALQLAFVAAGRLDGYIDLDLKPWDIAAGALLVKEAGGYVTDFNDKHNFLTTGNIIAANQQLHSSLFKIIAT